MNLKLQKTITAAAVIAAIAAPSAFGREPYIAGYTDFPNALRLAPSHDYIAGYTDFPNALRLQGSAPLTPIQQLQLAAASAPVAGTTQSSGTSVSWRDLGIGAAAGVVFMLGLTVPLWIVARKRGLVRAA